MKLSELAAYAEEKFHIREEYLWPDFPGFSVLRDPVTDKWVALLMRRFDAASGSGSEVCDLKCGRQSLAELSVPFLSAPFRMHGQKWVGIRFGEDTDPETVFRLFDRAVHSGEQRGYTIMLEDLERSGAVFRGTELPVPPQRPRRPSGHVSQAQRHPSGPESPAENRPPLQVIPAPEPAEVTFGGTDLPPRAARSSRIPDPFPGKIREMMSLYRYGSGSFAQKCRNFYRQARFMEDFEDDAPWDEDFHLLFPTYHDLSILQLRGYFTWRTRVRRGEYAPAASAYVYLYLYELLNGIGTASEENCLAAMKKIETDYLDAGYGNPSIRQNLRRWMLDYAVIRGIAPETAFRYVTPLSAPQDEALLVLKDPAAQTDREIFSALCTFAGEKTAASPVLLADEARGMHLFAEAWRLAAAGCRVRGQDLFTACFGELRFFPWHPLANAVYTGHKEDAEDTDYILNPCRIYRRRGGVWTEGRYDPLFFDKALFRSFVRETDRKLRRYLKTGRYLREKEDDAWASPFADTAAEADRIAAARAAVPDITISLSGLDRIREDALMTRDRLLTAEETAEEELPEKVPEQAGPVTEAIPADSVPAEPEWTDSRPAAPEDFSPAEPLPLTGLQCLILRTLLAGGTVSAVIREHHLMPSVIADEINEAMMEMIGDSIVECEGDELSLVEDYTEDLEELLGGDC